MHQISAQNEKMNKFRILIAEDNEINQKVIRIILEKYGYDFKFARNGEEALELYYLDDYHLVLMDCQMPKIDGLQACRKIREFESLRQKTRCPIVAMTANAMKGDREKCMEAGMDDFLSKPFRSQDLIQMIVIWSEQISGEVK